jgi:hypothetical protein
MFLHIELLYERIKCHFKNFYEYSPYSCKQTC